MLEYSDQYSKLFAIKEIAWEEALSDSIFHKAHCEDKIVFIHIVSLSNTYERSLYLSLFSDPTVQNIVNNHFIPVMLDKDDHAEFYLFALDLLLLSGQFSEGAINLFLLPDKRPIICFSECYKEIFLKTADSIYKGYIYKRDLLEEMANEFTIKIEKSSSIKETIENSRIKHSVFKEYIELWQSKILKGSLFYTKEYYNPRPASLITLFKYIVKYQDKELEENFLELLEFLQFSHLFDPIAGGFFHQATDFLCSEPSFEKRVDDNSYYLLLYTEAYKYYKIESFRDSALKIYNMLLSNFQNNTNNLFFRATSLTNRDDRHYSDYYFYSLNELITLFPEEYIEIAISIGLDITKDIFKKQLPIRNEMTYNILNKQHLDILRERRDEHIGLIVDKRIAVKESSIAIRALIETSHTLDQTIDSPNIFKAYTTLLNIVESDLKTSKLEISEIVELVGTSISLYRYLDDENYLITAIKLTIDTITLFYKPENGMFHNCSNLIKEILQNEREYNTDFIRPAANSVITEHLLELYKITKNSLFFDIAERQLQNIEPYILESGPFMHNWAQQFELYSDISVSK